MEAAGVLLARLAALRAGPSASYFAQESLGGFGGLLGGVASSASRGFLQRAKAAPVAATERRAISSSSGAAAFPAPGCDDAAALLSERRASNGLAGSSSGAASGGSSNSGSGGLGSGAIFSSSGSSPSASAARPPSPRRGMATAASPALTHHSAAAQHAFAWPLPAAADAAADAHALAHPALLPDSELESAWTWNERLQELLVRQERARRAALEDALAAAPEEARPTLRGALTLVGAAAAGADAVEAARALADAAARCSRNIVLRGRGWAGARELADLTAALKERAGLDGASVLRVLLRDPALLRARRRGDDSSAADALDALLQAVANSAHADGDADDDTSAALADLLTTASRLLSTPAATVKANAAYLAGTLRLAPRELLAAAAAHAPLLTCKPGTLQANLAFVVGLGARPDDVRAMLLAEPRWATLPLRDLSVSWQFVREELKGAAADVVAHPELLRLSLLSVLGPRAGFARRKRIKLLMPSYAAGHPILAQPRAQWAAHRMAPVRWWMRAPVKELCALAGADVAEFEHYRQAWRATTGDKWRRLALSPAPAAPAARGGVNGGSAISVGGSSSAFGGGGDEYDCARLVQLPQPPLYRAPGARSFGDPLAG